MPNNSPLSPTSSTTVPASNRGLTLLSNRPKENHYSDRTNLPIRLRALNRWLTPRLAFQGVNAGVTLVIPAPTPTPQATSTRPVPSFSFSLPSGSIPTTTSTPSASRSTVSATFVATVVGVNGNTSTFTRQFHFLHARNSFCSSSNTFAGTIVQGATVWRNDELHETCSLDGKGGAVCTEEVAGVFTTTFTGTAIPFFTVGATITGGSGGGSGGGGFGGSGGGSSGGGSTGGAPRVNGGASVGWMLVGSVAAMVAGMRLVL
ncbi:hypothetical protein B0H16DRAFT_1632726 [Mycena metata]|uniref:Uncharacterized protein n=1 Tax=Mycena metata TaxID=1033252 RepID=A0AAD7GZN9_9AGAR|nr:hypothetical protein B0H16DRAFT_1632726 [Mycena metata]